MQEITITRPDDWHIHLRDGAALTRTVNDAAKQFGRAIIMPNLVPPVTNAEHAKAYQQRIMAANTSGYSFEPLMTLYLTDKTTAKDIEQAHASGLVKAVKLYPAGATTNSDSGVTDLANCYEALEAMQALQMPLLVHGEVTDSEIDIFDRERIFLETKLTPLLAKFPTLKVVLEHITTADSVAFVDQADERIAATITAHHLLFNRNHMLAGGIRPHFYCLPILKRNIHQQALIKAATSGSPKFFLGTDSAPHTTDKKENACGCAGCYTAFAAIELYAQAFDDANALDKLNDFASVFGPRFYGLPQNTDSITLLKQSWQAPDNLSLGEGTLTPLCAGEPIAWQIKAG